MVEQSDRTPSLNEIARQTSWEPGFESEEDCISEVLKRAGLDPVDQRERQRFRLLVKAAYEQRIQDRLAELGECAAEAKDELGDDASPGDVLCRAEEIKEEMQDEEENSD